jgi:soluble lytic murein transglycosylase-like protein
LTKRLLQLAALVSVLGACAPAAEIAVLRNGFGIRHDSRQISGNMTRLLTASGYVEVPTDQIASIEPDDAPAAPPAVAPPATADVARLVGEAGDRHRIDPDLISSIINAESGFNPHARSPKGAQGLMQLMPGTASKLGVADAFDPGSNVDGGTRYLRELLGRYNGDMVKALAAYNAGPHRVEQYHGVPPYRETRAYVARIVQDFNRKKLAARGATPVSSAAKTTKSPHRNRAKAGSSSAVRPVAEKPGL